MPRRVYLVSVSYDPLIPGRYDVLISNQKRAVVLFLGEECSVTACPLDPMALCRL